MALYVRIHTWHQSSMDSRHKRPIMQEVSLYHEFIMLPMKVSSVTKPHWWIDNIGPSNGLVLLVHNASYYMNDRDKCMWRHMCMTRQCVGYSEWRIHWNENVDILTKFSSPTALEVVILTTSNAASDENFRHYRFRVRVKKLWQLLRVSSFIFPILAIAKYVSILVPSNSYPIKKRHNWKMSLIVLWANATISVDQSILVQVMAWCPQTTSDYLRPCWPRSMSLYGVINVELCV